MTYQRNMEVAFSGRWGGLSGWDLEKPLHEEVEERVERSQIGGQNGDEDQRDRGGLDQRVAVGPLNALELGPAGDEEAEDSAPLPLRGLGGGLPALCGLAAPALALLVLAAARPAADLVLGRRLGGLRVLRSADVRPRRRRGAEPPAALLGWRLPGLGAVWGLGRQLV